MVTLGDAFYNGGLTCCGTVSAAFFDVGSVGLRRGRDEVKLQHQPPCRRARDRAGSTNAEQTNDGRPRCVVVLQVVAGQSARTWYESAAYSTLKPDLQGINHLGGPDSWAS